MFTNFAPNFHSQILFKTFVRNSCSWFLFKAFCKASHIYGSQGKGQNPQNCLLKMESFNNFYIDETHTALLFQHFFFTYFVCTCFKNLVPNSCLQFSSQLIIMILLHNFFHWQRCYKAQLQFIQCNPLTRGSLFLGLLIDVHTWQFPSGLPTDRPRQNQEPWLVGMLYCWGGCWGRWVWRGQLICYSRIIRKGWAQLCRTRTRTMEYSAFV